MKFVMELLSHCNAWHSIRCKEDAWGMLIEWGVIVKLFSGNGYILIYIFILYLSHSQHCSGVTPCSSLRNYSWRYLGDNMGCWGSNPGWNMLKESIPIELSLLALLYIFKLWSLEVFTQGFWGRTFLFLLPIRVLFILICLLSTLFWGTVTDVITDWSQWVGFTIIIIIILALPGGTHG